MRHGHDPAPDIMKNDSDRLPDPSPRLRALVMASPSAYVPRTDWAATSAVIATLAIVAGAPLVAFAAARGYDWLEGLGEAGTFPPGAIERLLVTHEAVYLAVFNGTIIAFTFLAARRFGSRAIGVLALDPPAAGSRAYIASLLIAITVTAVWFSVVLKWMPEAVIEDVMPYRELMAREGSGLMPPILCLLAPLAEELLFRGFLFSAVFKTRLGFPGAALLTSAAWTALHVDRTSLAHVQLFASGVLLSWLLARTGSLRIPLLCHILFNTGVSFVVIVLRLPT
jgi:membrane protease YdiL (CAAX protease family)